MQITSKFRISSILWPLILVISGATVSNAGELAGAKSDAKTFWVAPTGKDSSPGTEEQPFVTLEAARDAIRNLKKNKGYPSGGVVVYLRGGMYERSKSFELGPEDSGIANAPVVYQSCPGEEARLVGGRKISAMAFKPAAAEFCGRVGRASARRHILQANLKEDGISNYGMLQPRTAVDFGSPSHYLPAPLELFVNGAAMTLARWPDRNESFPRQSGIDSARMNIEKDEKGAPKQYNSLSFKSEARYMDGDEPGVPPIFAMEHLRKWGAREDVFIAGCLDNGYTYSRRKITALDLNTSSLCFDPPVRLWSGYKETTAHQFHFINAPEELDTPGEYYLDRKTGILYFYPPAGWNSGSEVLVSELEDVLVAMENASHVRLSGLTLEVTRSSGAYIQGGEDNVIEKCVIRNTGIVGVQIGAGYDAATRMLLPRLPGEYRHALTTAMEWAANEGRHPRGGSALNRDGGRSNGVRDCRIYNTGSGGVLLGGGDRKTLEPAGNFVRDCEIHHTDRQIGFYAEAIVVDGVGNLVSGNYLHDSDGGLLYIYGNDQMIEYNEIANAAKTVQDCGAIEIRQNPSQLGNKIRFNFVHDVGRKTNSHTLAIYLDNDTHGVEVSGNLFSNIRGRCIQEWWPASIAINGGHLNTISNNLFVDCSGARINVNGKDTKETMGIFASRRVMLEQDVDVTKPPYATRYPEFQKLYAGDPAMKCYNEVVNNVLVGCGSSLIAEGKTPAPNPLGLRENLETDRDPGFVNAGDGDYSLRADSLIFKTLPTFQPIPFEKMRQARKWESR